MIEQYLNVITNYANFKGRASRKEFWLFILMHCIINVVLICILGSVGYSIYNLAVLVPYIAVCYRRIQDTGRSGHWTLLILTGIGSIVVFVMLLLPGTPGSNQYGPEPYDYGGGRRPSPPARQTPADYGATAPYSGPSPVSAASGQLEIIGKGGPMSGRCYPVDAAGLIFGRDGTARVRYAGNESGISRIHCKVFLKGGCPFLMDCGSTYGTYLERYGKLPPQKPVALKQGDTFYLGSKKNGFTIRCISR